MSSDQDYERTTKIVIVDSPRVEEDIRLFLNKLSDTDRFFDVEEKHLYYYRNSLISEVIYSKLKDEQHLVGILTKHTDLVNKHSIGNNLTLMFPGLGESIYSSCSVYYRTWKITIDDITDHYMVISSRDTDIDELKEAHKRRVNYILGRLSDIGYEYVYECNTVSDTHITTDEVCLM